MTIEALVARYGLAAIFLGAGLEGETAVVTGGVLAHRGLVPLVGVALAAILGSFVADQGFFLFGRHFREHRFVRRIRERPAFAKALDWLERYPRGFIFGYRFVYGIRTVSPIAIGASRIGATTFVAVNAVAAVIWGSLFTGIGYFFGQGLEALVGRVGIGHLLIGAAVVVVAGAAGWRVWRVWRAA
jgi:membrane protein DedA with SNARE-associated domain